MCAADAEVIEKPLNVKRHVFKRILPGNGKSEHCPNDCPGDIPAARLPAGKPE